MFAPLKIGPFIYHVDLDTKAVEHHSDDKLLGYCDYTDTRIVLRSDLNPIVLRETLLQEILHALLALSGFGSEWGEETEEAFVSRMSPLVLDFLRSNREAVDFLMENQ